MNYSLTIIIKSKTRDWNKIAKRTNGVPGRMVSIHRGEFRCGINAWELEQRKGNQRPEEARAGGGCFSLNCLISWLEVEINSSGVFVVWQDGKQNESWRGRGWGVGRTGWPWWLLEPREGWEGVCSGRGRASRKVCVSFHGGGSWLGAALRQRGARDPPEPRPFIL
jgi:hypothetical protein